MNFKIKLFKYYLNKIHNWTTYNHYINSEKTSHCFINEQKFDFKNQPFFVRMLLLMLRTEEENVQLDILMRIIKLLSTNMFIIEIK